MYYGGRYIIRFRNQGANGGQIININIWDTLTQSPTPLPDIQEHNLMAAGDPLHIRVIDNDEDKFTPIRAKEAEIKFLSDQWYNLSTFALNSEDDRWLVEITVEDTGEYLFYGHLVLNDCSTEFMDNYNHLVITLVATDGIGLLKDQPLTRPDGTVPKDYYTIIEYISWCLQKTRLQLKINVINNLMEETMQGLPAYAHVYIWAKTFEDEIGTLEDCYTVLEKILGEECFITQWRGEWWIMRIDEFDYNQTYYDIYSYDGTALGTVDGNLFEKTIGKDLPMQLIAPASIVTLERPHSFIEEDFRYELPREIIDNIDFSRGTYIGDVIVNGVTTKRYTIADWTTKRGTPDSGLTPLVTPYLNKIYDVNGRETERYVVIPKPAVPDTNTTWIASNPVPLAIKDKFNVSVDYRFSNAVSSGSELVLIMSVRLYGEDGSFWFLADIKGNLFDEGVTKWVQVPTWAGPINSGTGNAITFRLNFSMMDEDQWNGATWEAPPLPVGGNVVIGLHSLNTSAFPYDDVDIHYQNLQFDYIPYIDGTYRKFTAQSSKVSQTGNYRAKRKKQVFISDSPKKLFKGALFKEVNGNYQLTKGWYNAGVPFIRAMNPVDPVYITPLGRTQAFSVWNQYGRVMRIFDCNIKGLDTDSIAPDLINTFFISDQSPHTDHKYFMLLHYDMDFYRCTWQGFFAEVFDSALEKDYSKPFEFKYIENSDT